jgi:hypothetical protein
MLLHGAIALFSCTSLATTGAIVILQGTNDFIVGVGDRERARQRASRRHGAYVLCPSLTVSLSHCLWFVLLVLVLWREVRQEDPEEMYMYVEVKGNEHNRDSPKNWRDAEKDP